MRTCLPKVPNMINYIFFNPLAALQWKANSPSNKKQGPFESNSPDRKKQSPLKSSSLGSKKQGPMLVAVP